MPLPRSLPRSTSLLALSFTALAACGGSEPPPASPSSGPGAGPVAQAPAPAKPTPSPALLMLAKRDEMLSIVNPATLEVVAKVPVGKDPHEVIASPDGKLAYVSNYGGGRYNTITVVDLVAQTRKQVIDLGALTGPHGLTHVGGKLWFTAEGAKVVGSYDPVKGVVDWALGTGEDRTHMLIVAPSLEAIVTTNVASGTLSFLDKTTHPRHPNGPPPGPPPGGGGPPPGAPPGGPPGPPQAVWEQTLLPVGPGTEGFDIAPNGRELWAADAQDGTIAIVDVPGKKLLQRLDAKAPGANRLKITPDGRLALVSSLRGGELVVFDVATRAEQKRIPIGRGTSGILVEPSGARAFVACSPDGFVAVVDLKTLAVVGKIPSGNEPDGLAWVAAAAR